ncbi:MAG: right-handed parallel beta-helix repeat-containing protein, partial [Planctomycetota bacterium]
MRIKNRKTYPLIPVLLLATLCTFATGKTIYVDDDANGENNGSSWTDAYNYLQDALMTALPGDDIRVAQGIYKPNEFTLSKRPNLDRKETFQLKNGVAIRGGYAGIGEPNEDFRSVEQYETFLSGDLSGNDVDVNDPRDLLNEPTWAENSYHVVTGSVTGETSVLDGFTIIAGSHHGMYNQTGSPTIANCTFRGNRAERWGGGMFNSNSNPKLNNCTFSGNSTKWGGGMFNSESSPALTKCTFSGNSAEYG